MDLTKFLEKLNADRQVYPTPLWARLFQNPANLERYDLIQAEASSASHKQNIISKEKAIWSKIKEANAIMGRDKEDILSYMFMKKQKIGITEIFWSKKNLSIRCNLLGGTTCAAYLSIWLIFLSRLALSRSEVARARLRESCGGLGCLRSMWT